jgi:hypothetical protein
VEAGGKTIIPESSAIFPAIQLLLAFVGLSEPQRSKMPKPQSQNFLSYTLFMEFRRLFLWVFLCFALSDISPVNITTSTPTHSPGATIPSHHESHTLIMGLVFGALLIIALIVPAVIVVFRHRLKHDSAISRRETDISLTEKEGISPGSSGTTTTLSTVTSTE